MQTSTRAYKILHWLVNFDDISKSLAVAHHCESLISLATEDYVTTAKQYPQTYSPKASDAENWFNSITSLIKIVIHANEHNITQIYLDRLEDEYIKIKKKADQFSQIVRPSATRWHLARRTDMLRQYGEEIRKLHRMDDKFITVIVSVTIAFGQMYERRASER